MKIEVNVACSIIVQSFNKKVCTRLRPPSIRVERKSLGKTDLRNRLASIPSRDLNTTGATIAV